MSGLDPLRQTIFDRQSEEVWRLAPHALRVEAEAVRGSNLLDLALSTGELSSVLALWWNGATSESWLASPELLAEYMRYLSSGFRSELVGRSRVRDLVPDGRHRAI